MMFYQLILFAAGAALFSTLSLVIYTAVTCRLARWWFKRVSRGLPMVHDQRTLGNGAISWALRKNLGPEIVKLLPQYQTRTIAWLYHTKPAALTVDLDLIKKILDEPNKHMNRTDTLNLPLPEFEHSIMLAEGEKWRRLRRYFAPALKSNRLKSPNVMNEIESSIEKLIGLIEAKLADKRKEARGGGRRVNMDDLAHRYSINLVFSCLYKQPDLVNFDERPCRWAEMVDDGYRALQTNPFVHASIVFPILRPLIDWLIYHFDQQGVWRREILQFIKRQTRLGFEARKQLQELRAAGQQVDPDNFTLKDGTKFRRNMIDHVIDHFLDGKLTQDEFLDTSFFLLNAADKTSSDAISHILYQLAVNSQIQERLRKSIREHGADSEYLAWVINESIRLRPPVTIGCSRTLAHDLKIEGGYLLPKGTFVITPAYAIHRLPEYWGQDADEFRPDRWQDTSGHHPLQYIPFGYGPRACLGRDFALFEMKQLMSALLSRYKFEAKVKEDLDVFDTPLMITIVPNSPSFITIKRLEPQSMEE